MTHAPEPTGWVGRPMLRREDRTLLTGRGRFVDDLAVTGALHLLLARCPHAHARIRSLDISAARRAPGVVAVVTAEDLGAIGPVPLMRLAPGTLVPEYPLLAAGVVRAQGVPVAAVVAESTYAAADGVDRLAVEYEPLDGISDPDGALEPGAPQVVPESRDNRALTVAWRHGDPDRVFRDAAHRVSLTVQQQRLCGVPMEPRGALARWDPDTGELTVWTSTQAPFRIRSSLARMLGLDEARVRVIAPDVGGGFGVKGGPYREEVLVAWLARRLGRPVKWMSTRSEDLLTTNHGRGGKSTGELALDAEGRITGLRARIRQPLGSSLAVTVGGTPQNHGRCLPGSYLVEHVDIESVGVFTTTPPVGAYRGAGRPEAAFLIERLVDEAARSLRVDPVELRRRNLIPKERFPFKTATGQVYDSGDYAELLDRTLALADYAGLRRAQAARRARGEVVGVGVATYVEPSGLGWESGQVRVEQTGAVLAVTGSSAHGQGHETTFAQIIADELGVTPEAVTVRHGDTHGAPQGIGTFGSRSTALGGSALVLAARDVREKARALAAGLLEAAPQDVVAVNGGFGVVGAPGRRVTWARVAEFAYRGQGLPAGTEPGLEATRFFSAEGEVWSAGAFVVSVRIDRDTGTVTPERIVWLDDAGTIVNPLLADGQLEGSLAQGWGQVMMEDAVLDRDGHLLSGTLMDYAVPRADDVPHAEIGHAHTPSPNNPLGVKGIGEAGTIGIPPVMVNAVVDALAPFGVTHLDMPLTPEKIWRALSPRGRGDPRDRIQRAMAILKVARLGHPVLRKVAEPVDPASIRTPAIQRLIDDMIETMREYDGAGLAATQVHTPKQIAVIEVLGNPRYPDAPAVPLMVLVNPIITPLTEEMEEGWEGCLSVPDMRGMVPRYTSVRLQCLDREGQKIDVIAKDFFARVCQHETDHLNGMVYLDRMRNLSTLSFVAEWNKHWLGIREQDD